jgi:hypothetical protein
VVAVLVIVVVAVVVVRYGPDPRPASEAVSHATGSESPTVVEEEAEESPAPAESDLSEEQLAELRAAREAVSDEEIMRQLAATVEEIAKDEPIETEAPAPAAPPPPPIQPDSNRALGYHLMREFGFAEDQWPALDNLWRRESGWNHLAENPSSGAYGIPQSLPANKMSVVGDDWRTNPETQIRWGLAYIRARYGTPDRAWQHFLEKNWY